MRLVFALTNFPIQINQSESAFSRHTFSATITACVLDLRPTVAEPCFTASIAYSI